MVVMDAGGGGGDVIIITHSTEGASSDFSVLSGIYSGHLAQQVDSHQAVAEEPVGVIFREYDPVFASLFGALF